MIAAIARFFSQLMHRWLPDAFLFAIILTFVVFVTASLSQDVSPLLMVDYWGGAVWSLLGFSMQMLLILVSGHVLAEVPVLKQGLRRIAEFATSPTQAILLTTFISALASWFNWGFGLIIGGLMARMMGQVHKNCHYPLLVAAAYSGFVVWHAGLSGSIPLKVASGGDDILGQLLNGQLIPLADTVFSPAVLLTNLVVICSLPVINSIMQPPAEHTQAMPNVEDEQPISHHKADLLPAEKLEVSRWPSLLLGMLMLLFVGKGLIHNASLSLNSIILIFLGLSLSLHPHTQSFLRALSQAIRGVGGIVIQFPLYAGIMGMMMHSGLADSISQWFVDVANADNFAAITFISAGLVNFFVPSGGGQWAIQAPIVIPAATELGVPLSKAAMAVAFGDAWTNLIQPFWALPMLAIAGLSIRHIMGYCVIALAWTGLIFMVSLTWFI